MKKIIYSVALIVFVSFLFSCGGGDVEKNILGEWKVEEVKLQNMQELIEQILEDEMGGAEIAQAELDKFKKEIEDELNDDIIGDYKELTNFNFKDDYTLTSDTEGGEWSFSDDKKIITLRFDDIEMDFEINELNSKSLDFTTIIDEDGYEFKIQMICKK